ncbi:MAG: lamin tail domain-containing protein, partial [Verrucomicrobia bacterium]|nr:lamin tail domain-containing protein [Verrucomicrobiota bacterium]
YLLVYPPDDPWLGETELSLLMPGNGGGDASAQRETHTYWIASELGIPFNYARHVNLFVNGQRRSQIYVDSQQPNGTFMDQWYPDNPGSDLYKMAIWFEMDDSAAGFSAAGVSMGIFNTAGGRKDLARYRWNWQKRAVADSSNNYTNLFALMDAVNTPLTGEAYTALIDSLVDVNEWSRIFAVEKIIGNGDSYGNGGGQNMYTGKPEGDRWKMLLWDVDFAFAAGAADSDMYYWSDGPLQRIFTHPPFQRVYYQTLLDAVNGPLLASRSAPMLDARYNVFVDNGLGPENPQGIKDYIATRRANILATVTNVVAPFAVTSNGGVDFSTNRNLVVLTGTAPLQVSTITVNGVPCRINWDSVTNWSLRLALTGGTNRLVIQGWDRQGLPVAGASDSLAVNFTGVYEAPQNKLAINELMYHPVTPNASYIEILNTSAANAFDLSNWRISGLDCTIPPGTIIQPGQFLVFVKDRVAFSAAYGANIPIAGEFAGSFAKGGETIALIQPGLTPAQDIIIDRVAYDNDLPWPAAADGTGSSLQLIDPAQDHSRVANWAAAQTNTPPPPPQWQYVTASGTASSSTLYIYLQTAGDVYLDDLKLVAGNVPEAGPNVLSGGDFESAFPGAWIVSPNHAASVVSTAIKHSGNASLHLIASSGGTTRASSIYQDISPALAQNQPYTLSFWYLQSTNGGPLTLRLSGFGINVNISPAPPTDPAAILCTPGAPNSISSNLPPFPSLWLNEVLPNNVNSLTDRFGEHEPWVELYNSSTNPVSLAGCYLTDTYTNLTKWPFPSGALLTNRQFLVVWMDGQPEQSNATEWHTSFRIPPDAGSVALVQSNSSGVRLLDYLNYSVPSAGRSYGDYPDGNPTGRQLFSIITPAHTNDPTGTAVQVRINEWMADNTATLADPADGDHEDWFELYNPGTNTVDLSGYYLTDTLTNKTKFQIPDGFLIQAGEYKLVWADSESGQNAPGRDLHVNFKLRASGQAIGLYAPGGGTIDAIVFGQQSPDVSQGRFHDGQTPICFMPHPTPGAANVVPQDNSPPVLDPIPDQTVVEGALLTFTATATDSNTPAQILSFSLDPGAPSGAFINSDTGVFTWVPTEAQGPGSYQITLRVTDNGSTPMSHARTFTVQVMETNNAPLLTPLGNQTINELETLILTNTATDPDGAGQTIVFTLEPGAPAGMNLNPTNGVLTWTPSEIQGPGAYLITIRATDNGQPPASSTLSFGVVVNETNSTPIVPNIASQTNHLGHTFTFAVNATDPDWPPNTLSYALMGAPTNAAISAAGIFTWTPTAAQAPRTNTFNLRVLDNGLPPKFVYKLVTLVVLQPMGPLSIARSNDTVQLRWSAIPGLAYQPQSKPGLGDSAWTDLGQPVTVSGTNATITDMLGTNAQRFYRVISY